MSELTSETEIHSENDLLFSCPHCEKSMAIELRGMGLTIQCPDCHGLVKVPKLTEKELKKHRNKHVSAESAQPREHFEFLSDLNKRLKGIHDRYQEIDTQFTRQQQTLESLQQEVQHLQEAMDALTQQISVSVR